MFDFIEKLQFGKKVKAHGKYWHYIANARHIFKPKDSESTENKNIVEGEYVIAAPYGAEPPCDLKLIFIPKGKSDEVGEG